MKGKHVMKLRTMFALVVTPLLIAAGLITGAGVAFAGTTPSVDYGGPVSGGTISCTHSSGCSLDNMSIVDVITSGTSTTHITVPTGWTRVGNEEHGPNTTDIIEALMYHSVTSTEAANGYTVPNFGYYSVWFIKNACIPSVCTSTADMFDYVKQGSSVGNAISQDLGVNDGFTTNYSNELAMDFGDTYYQACTTNVNCPHVDYSGLGTPVYGNWGGMNNMRTVGTMQSRSLPSAATASSYTTVGTFVPVGCGCSPVASGWAYTSVILRNHL